MYRFDLRFAASSRHWDADIGDSHRWVAPAAAIPSAVADIRDDIHETLKQCQEIYLDEWQSRPWYEKIVQWILHLFAPVL